MRTSIENWLLRHWYGSHQPPWYLRMLEPLYRSAYLRAQQKQRARSIESKPGIPLFVVGNITAGGSGKTPLVIRLVQLAGELGLKAGIASTGYGRKSRETVLVKADSDTLECGDEPVLLAQRTGVPVVVSASRLDAVNTLNAMNLDLVFSDDGLQHADLLADIEICVIDGQRGLGNGHLIPAGPLREPVARLYSVDHVVCNGVWAGRPADLAVNVMDLKAVLVRSLDDTAEHTLEEFQEQHGRHGIHAYAGIGNPQRFFTMLQGVGLDAEAHAYSDHHRFTRQDFSAVAKGASIVMTEKDAVKCRTLGLNNAWYVPVETHLSDQFERILKDQMSTLTRDLSDGD